MKPAYLIRCADMTPDRLRGGTQRDCLVVRREPGKTNMSHQSRVDGWLGQTGDVSYHAMGEYTRFEDLCDAIDEAGYPEFDRDELLAWCTCEDDDDYTIGVEATGSLVLSGPAGTMILPPDEAGGYSMDFDVAIRDGWTEWAWYGDPYGWNEHPIADYDCSPSNRWEIDDLASVLDEAKIKYDRFEYAQGTTSDDAWGFDSLFVRTEDMEAATAAVLRAVAAERDDEEEDDDD